MNLIIYINFRIFIYIYLYVFILIEYSKLKNSDERHNFKSRQSRGDATRFDLEKSPQRILTRETRPLIKRPLIKRRVQDLGHTIRTLRVPQCDRCAAVKAPRQDPVRSRTAGIPWRVLSRGLR